MSGSRVSDLSKLHLKRELTQIKKASRVLRDPGTSSSWKSPLNSSRSVAATVPAVVEPPKVFLHNWKTHKSSSEKSGLANNESSWTQQASLNDGDVSDARKGGDSMTFRCRDTNLASKRRKKSKRNNIVARSRCDSAGLSDETEDPRHITGASPLLLKQLKRKNWSRSLKTSRKEDSSCTHNSTPSSFNIYALPNPSNVGSWDGTTTTCDGDDDELGDNLDSPGRQQGCGIWTKKATTKGGDDDELYLEAQSRLDWRRWSTSCRSQDGSDVAAIDGSTQSFSQKYRLMFFDELIGQSIVVQSLMNAVKRCRIAPVYLFHGPRGTGKTSTARIFSAALNCVATEEMKPCGYCKECHEFMSGKSKDFCEVDGVNKVRYLLRNLPKKSSTYKVFVIDECHLLPSKTWLSFLKFLENPLKKVVFIFITTDLDNVPRTIQSRCQKFLFDKVKDGEIVVRLKKIASEENLDVESHALDLIAVNADGSLRDAETMLEQLSLLGKRITTGLVNELVGVVSDEKLLELLELALSSDTAETVKRARDLLDLGADPIVLMFQLASLIMDIIAGSYKVVDEKYSEAFLDGHNLSETDMEGLKHALKLLSEAEKQLRVSNDRSTWFTATLLQLGSMPSPGTTRTGCSSRRQSSRATDDDRSSVSREVMAYKQRIGGLHFSMSASPKRSEKHTHEASSFSRVIDNTCYKASSSSQTPEREASIASHSNSTASSMMLTQRSSQKLNEIWRKCVEICHSKTLRQLLYTHGKLISISEVEGILVSYIAFGETEIKTRAERFLSSITNSMEMVLRRSVEVRILLLPETELLVVPYQTGKPDMTNKVGDLHAAPDLGVGNSEEGRSKIPMQRIESIIREQRLETAWLQTADKDTPGLLTRIKPERNQILPQEDTYRQPSALLRIGENGEIQENLTGRGEHCPLSPSLLHDSKFGHKKDNIGGYESGTGRVGCNMLRCWNTNKTQRSSKGKGTHVRPRRSGKRGFSLFNGCAKPRKLTSR
ncbi:BnaC02g34560D [Brassica napus]|uniref:BnaC02g34560D protein n=1 Tax=Brassica napus TaxID=3708 RepID=A0A078FSK8_BRANA|nr:BnaC02g34560D [Brassica napus]